MTIDDANKIKQPLMTYHFMVDSRYDIANNVTSVSFDRVNKTMRMSIRATVDFNDFNEVDDFSRSGYIMVCAMNGHGKTLFSIQASIKKLIRSDFVLDYAKPEIATHELEWEYLNLLAIDLTSK